MDIKTLLNNLHEEVSCSVCMSTFTEPKQLPCLHSFCLHCLSEILRTSGRHDVIKCPECRTEYQVPRSGNLRDFPTNFRINSLLDVLAIKECNTTGVKCGNCDMKKSHCLYCFQCCAFWCDDCIVAHNIIRANKEHRVLALKHFQDKDFESILKRPAFCQKKHHEKEELKLFCKICEVAICSACALTDHEDHAKILLEEASNERKSQIKFVIDSQKGKAKDNRNKITELDETLTEFEAQAAAVKRNVQTFAEKMIDAIHAEKQEMFLKVDNHLKELRERVGGQKKHIEHYVKIIETAVEKTELLVERSTSAEIVQLNEPVITMFQDELSEEEEVNCDLEGSRQLVFLENKTLMDKTYSEGIGSLKSFLSNTKAHQSSAEGKGISEAFVGLRKPLILTTRDAAGEQCYEERDYVTVEVRNDEGLNCATEARVQDNKDGSYNISYVAKETGKCNASVKVNGNHVRGSPFTVEVKSRQFRPVLSFGQQGSSVGMFDRPWGVAVNERNDIAVTDIGNSRVQVFSSDGTYLRSFGRKGDKDGEFIAPAGVAFDTSGNIVVADSRNNRVQLFSEQGEYLTQFAEKGNLDHQLCDPLGLSVDSDGNIIVADFNNKLVKIFSPSGQLLRKIGEDTLTSPIHCVQHNKYLLVSDCDVNCVKVFDREGNFVRKFGKEGCGNGDFNELRCLSIDKAGHLLVCDRNNSRLQLFEPSGKFLGKVGTRGRKLGQFHAPLSSAVLTDGKIIVADVENHCIQIFE